ncbi:lactate dehydrogenase-like 2-hydroxyacid dehydrogenase [Pararhizobium capsulatum DSM 1112]|uniref:Lactate dehydrogenase-like 2-hydroxyacid dehydrogenase n=1 Tax=Pararhizobium capsulatum DSM 1112 TaxID=1121113 RepID=A0ABU0BV77_9HYPH|nr:2-hydroxyacid dehydrogenase [Pararhizobium capsulatum]MDQ0321878.1 lactate dehydrogenase-like 2-hydroxyacid dehydrogenase [Pararhizobium capsulatum DSM 1112]
MAQQRPIVLVPGKMSQRVLDRLPETFELVRLASADPALVTAEDAARVSGIAIQGKLASAFIDAFPKLEIIASFGVGYDGVDAAHAASRGVAVTNTPDVLTDEVADTAIGLLLNTLRRFPVAENYLRQGRWARDGAFPLSPLTLRGRTVGFYGLGRIGLAIAHRLESFGVSIGYHTRSKREDISYAYYPTLKTMADAVDTMIVIVPGSESTRATVNADVLSALGKNGVLINVGRGSTVDEKALVEALEQGVIAAAGLDVFENEPHVPEALMTLENVSLLPHVGSASEATRNAMGDLVVDNLIAWFDKGEALTPVPETPFRRSKSQA